MTAGQVCKFWPSLGLCWYHLARKGHGCFVQGWVWRAIGEGLVWLLLGGGASPVSPPGFLDTPVVGSRTLSHSSLLLGAAGRCEWGDCLKAFFLARHPLSWYIGLREQASGGVFLNV